MQRIALFSTGIRSDISTDLAIAEKLTRLNLKTVICAYRNGDESRVRANGVAFEHYERRELATLNAIFDRLQDERGGSAPVLYLCHAELHREQLVGLARDLPLVAIDSHVSVDRTPGIMPLTSTRLPTSGRTLIAWMQWRRLLTQRHTRQAFLAQIQALKQLSTELGLAFDDIATFDHWHPVRFNPVPYWCLAARELDYFPEKPRSTPHLGPQISQNLYEPQTVEDSYTAARQWIEASPDLIYCSFGSLLSDQRLLLEVVRAARSRSQMNWLIGVNALATIPELGELPDNVRVLRDVPQRAVLQHAKAMITGAGIATINECIAARVPMVVYSLGVLDQNGNAARVGWHGLGVVGERQTDKADNILAHLDQLVGDNVEERIDEMAGNFDRYDQDEVFIQAIKTSLDHQTPNL